MCQFMQKQATEKGITWRLMISPDIAEVFNKHRYLQNNLSTVFYNFLVHSSVSVPYYAKNFFDLESRLENINI